MLWTPPSMFRFPILQVSLDWMNEWMNSPSYSFESLWTSHSAWRKIPGKSLGVIPHQGGKHTHAIPSSSTAGRSSWCVSLKKIYLGAWQVDLELWGGETPWTKPCWFAPLWPQESQGSQPASALLGYFWFWGNRGLILRSDPLFHFSESNKTSLHCSFERENIKQALSISKHFYILY